ncbi:hypothetical protein D3C87_1800880 [compost metagenome]
MRTGTQGQRNGCGVVERGEHQDARVGKLDAQHLDQRNAVDLGRAQRIVDQQHVDGLGRKRPNHVATGLELTDDKNVPLL